MEKALRTTLATKLSIGPLCALSLMLPSCSPDETHRPNVILVSIDTLRADHTGLYGYGRDTTPFLDRFGEQCTVFENAFSPVPWTLPAHVTMLTGLSPSQHGVVEEDLAISPDVPMLAERLGAMGYQTVGLYFPGWIKERYGFGRGFNVFRSHRNAEEANAHLQEALKGLVTERPLFLFLHLFDVHSAPFLPEERSPYRSPDPFHEFFLPGAEARLPDVPAQEIWEDGVTLDSVQIEGLVALYDGGIRYADSQVEAAFSALDQAGLMSNSLVIVTADHGEALGQRGQIGGHGNFYNEGLHVPLLVRDPLGAWAGRRLETAVSLADIVPTVLSQVGLAPEPHYLGRSLLDPNATGRVVTGSLGDEVQYFVRWPMKAVRYRDNAVAWDLLADPSETHPIPIQLEQFMATEEEVLGNERGSYRPPPLEVDAPRGEELNDLLDLGYGG